MKKKRSVLIILIIIAVAVIFSASVIAFDLFGIKTYISVNTGYLYPFPPKVETIEDFSELSGLSFEDGAVLNEFKIDRLFDKKGYPKYVENDLWTYDSIITMPEENVEPFISMLESKGFEFDYELRYSEFDSKISNGERFEHIYYGDQCSYSPDKPNSGVVTRGGWHNVLTGVFIKNNEDKTATVCVARVYYSLGGRYI